MGYRYCIKWGVKRSLKNNDSVVVEGLQRIRPGLEVKATYENIQPFSQAGALEGDNAVTADSSNSSVSESASTNEAEITK